MRWGFLSPVVAERYTGISQMEPGGFVNTALWCVLALMNGLFRNDRSDISQGKAWKPVTVPTTWVEMGL